MKNAYFPVLMISVFMMACSTMKENKNAASPVGEVKPFVLKYERGPCFGACPVYAFYLMDDHTGIVHAKANLMDKEGWYFARPDQEAIVEILELIEPHEWWVQNLSNQPEIADLPTSSIVYYHPSGIRTITIQSRTTHQLEEVFTKLSHLVTESRWEPTLIRPMENTLEEKTDVIVQLKEGVDFHSWMAKFSHYGIHLKRRLSPNQHYYLVARDPKKGKANDFLQYIKIDPDVIDAQWDNPVHLRKQ
jgi:hypothetical protein